MSASIRRRLECRADEKKVAQSFCPVNFALPVDFGREGVTMWCMDATNRRIAFIHAALGRLEGDVVKMFKNGKFQVQCEARLSRADGHGGVRKTTYNVRPDEVEGTPAYERDVSAFIAKHGRNP